MDLARKYLMNFGYAGIKIAILKDYWGAKFFSTDRLSKAVQDTVLEILPLSRKNSYF